MFVKNQIIFFHVVEMIIKYIYMIIEKKSIMNVTAHHSEVNSIDFNPLNEFFTYFSFIR